MQITRGSFIFTHTWYIKYINCEGKLNYSLKFNDPAPLYEQIENLIKEQIESGELKEGTQIGSQNELAKKFNVSVITVKKALLNLVTQGYLYTRVGKGTYVADLKRNKSKKFKDHKTIGLVLRDLKHPFFSMIVQSIEEKAYELDYTLLLSSSSNKIEKEESQINHFKSLGVDGLIIASLSLEYKATPYIQKLHEENFPYIIISYMHDPQYWFIGSDHDRGGYLATEHLIKLGYNKIGYVHIGRGNLLSEVRKNGYTRALMDNDISFDLQRIYSIGKEPYDTGEDRVELGYQFGKEFEEMNDRPDALFFYNDTAALGFVKYLNEVGIKVPDDVAIVGYDDVELASFASVPLTTIRQPVQKIGSNAVDIVNKRILGLDAINRTIFTPELVIRESCGAGLKRTN